MSIKLYLYLTPLLFLTSCFTGFQLFHSEHGVLLLDAASHEENLKTREKAVEEEQKQYDLESFVKEMVEKYSNIEK